MYLFFHIIVSKRRLNWSIITHHPLLDLIFYWFWTIQIARYLSLQLIVELEYASVSYARMIWKKKRYGDKARWRMLKIWDIYDFCNNNSCDLPFLAPLASSGPTTIRYPAGLRVFMGSTPLCPGTILTFRSWRFSYWQKSSGAPKLKPSTTPNKQITAITQTKSIFSNAIQIIFGKRTSRYGNRKCKRWLFLILSFRYFLRMAEDDNCPRVFY